MDRKSYLEVIILPFEIVRCKTVNLRFLLEAVMGLIKLILGLIGGVIGLVFGIVGGALGLVFGLVGLVLALVVGFILVLLVGPLIGLFALIF